MGGGAEGGEGLCADSHLLKNERLATLSGFHRVVDERESKRGEESVRRALCISPSPSPQRRCRHSC